MEPEEAQELTPRGSNMEVIIGCLEQEHFHEVMWVKAGQDVFQKEWEELDWHTWSLHFYQVFL